MLPRQFRAAGRRLRPGGVESGAACSTEGCNRGHMGFNNVDLEYLFLVNADANCDQVADHRGGFVEFLKPKCGVDQAQLS